MNEVRTRRCGDIVIFTRNCSVMNRVRIYFSCDYSYIYITSPYCSVAVHFKGQPNTANVTNSIVYVDYEEWIYSAELYQCTRAHISFSPPKLSWFVVSITLWLKSSQERWLQRFSYLTFVVLVHRTCVATRQLRWECKATMKQAHVVKCGYIWILTGYVHRTNIVCSQTSIVIM